jgi:hypothetical protein
MATDRHTRSNMNPSFRWVLPAEPPKVDILVCRQGGRQHRLRPSEDPSYILRSGCAAPLSEGVDAPALSHDGGVALVRDMAQLGADRGPN